jgi:GR25 family glycosyltransferase involved in LPS biosynthesis
MNLLEQSLEKENIENENSFKLSEIIFEKNTFFNDLKIIVLTLKDYPERLNIISDVLIKMATINIKYEIYYGTNGNNIKIYDTENDNIKLLYHNFETYYYDKTKRINKQIMKKGELGCAWGHLSIYKKLCSDKIYNKYLIFEDDACLIENLDKTYNILKNLPNNFDVCHMGNSIWFPFNRLEKINDYFYKIEKRYINCLTAYIVSKSGAQKLLEHANNFINIPADDLLSDCFLHNNNFNLYVPEKYLFLEKSNNISLRETVNNI